MQFTSTIASLILAGSALAAPASDVQKRSNLCGKIGVTKVAAATSYGGQYATPKQCSQTVKYAGYNSFSYDHVDGTCSYYNQAVSGLNVQPSSGTESIFWDKGCGEYTPQCNIQIGTNNNYALAKGPQYQIANVTLGWSDCVAKCDSTSDCFSMAISNVDNSCYLYNQTTSYLNSIQPAFGSTPKAVQMSDLFCEVHTQ